MSRFRLRDVPRILWLALKQFFGDNGSTMAAALSFTTVFSMPALLGLVLMLVGKVADPVAVQRAIINQVGALIGPAAANQVQTIITSARASDIDPSVAAVLGGVALLFGATGAFAQLQAALNRAWNVKPDPRRGDIRNFLVKRIFSFGVVLVVAFLLLVSLTLSAFLSSVGSRLTAMIGLPDVLLKTANVIFSFAIIAMMFGAMFMYLPDAKISWRDVAVGAIGTAILFVGGKELIGLYLGKADPGSAFGAAGSLVVVLLWIYYSSIILLFGASFTRVWAELYGRGVRPERGAVEFIEQEKPVKAG